MFVWRLKKLMIFDLIRDWDQNPESETALMVDHIPSINSCSFPSKQLYFCVKTEYGIESHTHIRLLRATITECCTDFLTSRMFYTTVYVSKLLTLKLLLLNIKNCLIILSSNICSTIIRYVLATICMLKHR